MRTFKLGSQVWRAMAITGFAWLAADGAAAQDCARDADCGDGFVCHSERYETCGRVCNGDDNCEPSACETSEFRYCVNAPCSADTECPASMRCYAPTYTACSGSMSGAGGAFAWGGAGGAPAPSDWGCHEETGDATCTARYTLPCTTADDCGPGFACEEQVYSVCSGGYNGAGGFGYYGGAGGANTDSPPSDRMMMAGLGGAGGVSGYECHEESTGTSACRLLEVACESTSDCDDGLECQPNPNYWPCGNGGGAGGYGYGGYGYGGYGAGAGGYVDRGAGTGGLGSGGFVAMGSGGFGDADQAQDPEPEGNAAGCMASTVPTTVCAPPNYYGYGGMYPGGYAGAGGQGGYANGAGGMTGGMTTGPSNGGPDSAQGGRSGSSGGEVPGHAGSTSTGDSSDDDDADDADDVDELHRGCSVSGDDAGAQLSSWAMLIGLVAFGLRRRARRVG